MTPQQFIAKWQKVNLSERAACQQHFLDLCELLDQPKPAEADPDGTWYTFEKGVKKTDGGDGWADVWKRGYFGWEYKGKHKDLKAAYSQLLLYREDLENPPLLVVCDMDRFEVHTNFTATAKRKYEFDLAGLARPDNLEVLRKLFTDPGALRPGITSEAVTVEAAGRFGELADGMRQMGVEPLRAAHFLMKLMFCMFGQGVGLLPAGLFSRLLDDGKANPASLKRRLENLFSAMAKGGDFGPVEIPWFNGGLFDDNDALPMTGPEINTLVNISKYDWASVEPSIFGTLFQRTLDPSTRSQIGAQYTSRNDIETLLKPVLLAPLRREWEGVKRKCEEELWPAVVKASRSRSGQAGGRDSRQRKAFDRAILDFAERLHHVTVLDPACGSGNFLYVAVNMLLDLEKEVIAYAATRGLSLVPHVGPAQLHGLEINPYAQQLAQVVIWIGYLQWMHYNGFKMPDHPVLAPIESIRRMDAILDLSDPQQPKEPEWPEAEFIVGNPPFLGDKKMRGALGDEYVKAVRRLYQQRLPGQSDLCCFWFEKARAQISDGKCMRAGLLATQNIRGGASRQVLQRISKTGGIFFGISDRDWVLDGALVHISMVGFDNGAEKSRVLNGVSVGRINTDLTARTDITESSRLSENIGMGFIGSCKGGSFDIAEREALGLLAPVGNPHGRPNSDVVRPVMNSRDLLGRVPQRWIIDNAELELATACLYERPHAIVEERVKPDRDLNRDDWLRKNWWRPQRMRPEMRRAVAELERFIVTPTTSKHRLFAWLAAPTLPDHKLVVFARCDDYFFGIVHSRAHEVWCRVQGTQLRERESGLNYNVQSSFETFALPRPTADQGAAIGAAAKALDDLRNRWLNPSEWTKAEVLEFPGSADGPWARFVVEPDKRGIGTVRWPRIVPIDADCAESLKKRTLTNLYNQRPAWLDMAHKTLDEAVFAAYGWDPAMSDDQLLERLLRLNLERSQEDSQG